MTLPAPFLTADGYGAAFSAGLSAILQQGQLGSFILGMANATFDRELHRELKPQLRERFHMLSDQVRAALCAGQSVTDAGDDLLVFLKLMAVGFDQLQPTRFRQVGPWELQFNQLRSFRPARLGAAPVTELLVPFDPRGFHFNKPFLAPEIFWEGMLLDRHCRLLYNKFPFAELHGLLVIEPAAQHPQFLAQSEHGYIWSLLERLGRVMPGAGFAYNSCGAYASVNHLHFQMFVRRQGCYPVEHPCWLHNGGSVPYAVSCRCFTGASVAWSHIETLHTAGTSYNLLYRPGKLYVIARAAQGSYQHAGWTGGFAWAETAGSLTTFNSGDFAALAEADIMSEFSKLSLPSPGPREGLAEYP